MRRPQNDLVPGNQREIGAGTPEELDERAQVAQRIAHDVLVAGHDVFVPELRANERLDGHVPRHPPCHAVPDALLRRKVDLRTLGAALRPAPRERHAPTVAYDVEHRQVDIGAAREEQGFGRVLRRVDHDTAARRGRPCAIDARQHVAVGRGGPR